MPVFSVPIVPAETAKAVERYLDGEYGLAPKVARPVFQPKIVPIIASSKREAVILAAKFHPGWAADSYNIMKARNA